MYMNNRSVQVTPAGPTVILARQLAKSFGDVAAVVDVSLEVGAGEVLAVLGPNGAGKSTTIHMLTTVLEPESGEASILGFDVQRQPDVVRQLIGVAGQGSAVDEQLTGRENLALFARLYKLPRSRAKQRTEELVAQLDLGSFVDRLVGTYSGGQRRRLDLAAALVAEPPALFLDEPTTGLDPASRADLWEAVTALAASGTAIVLTTQYLEEADRLADRVMIVDQGRVVAQGTPESLKQELRSDVLAIRMCDDAGAQAAEMLMRAAGHLVGRADGPVVQVPVNDDPGLALTLLALLQKENLPVADFQLRRPTLDDVFLEITSGPVSSPSPTSSLPQVANPPSFGIDVEEVA